MVLAMVTMPLCVRTLHVRQHRKLAAQYNISALLVFGDSTVDPGNNNDLFTFFKANFPPYGKGGFFNGTPTGRFCDGRLSTDLIAESLGLAKVIPAYLDPNLKNKDLLHGVSFASSASGYDDLTCSFTNVLTISKQLENFKEYKVKLSKLVGERNKEEIIKNAIFALSMGTNDFIQNYYIEPIRSRQYSVEAYSDYLVKNMANDLKAMHDLGARKLVVIGLPPIGCLPLVKTLKTSKGCYESYNNASFSFNSKVNATLAQARTSLGMKIVLVDIYGVFQTVLKNPKKFGFTETSYGCCGSGTIEYSITCRGRSTCEDPTNHLFWDAVHPTEAMYKIIAQEALRTVKPILL